MKVAILVKEDRALESWETALFERLTRNPEVAITAFVVARPSDAAIPPSLPFRLVSALDRRLFGRANDAPFEGVMGAYHQIPKVHWNDWIKQSGDVDVLLAHCATQPAPIATELWEYHFNVGSGASPQAFGFSEVLAGQPVTELAVLRRRPDGTRDVACRCTSGTKFSAAFNAAYAKGMLPSLVERELVRSARGRSRADHTQSASLDIPSPPRQPSFGETALYCARLIATVVRRMVTGALRKLGGEPGNWSLVVSEGDILNSPLDRLTELKQPKGEFRADPFLFERGGEKYVFFEACGHDGAKGRIEVGRIAGDRLEDVRALDLGDAHNSYPYIFEHRGDVFMIPETHERNRVEVWRCVDFPGQWTLHATALEGESPADTVLFEWEGQHWLFTNLGSGSFHDHCAELHVYRVDGPDLETIEPHPLNPVVIDTTSARNGGRPFIRDGKLIRPGQITSHGLYGYGLKLLEVTRLSMDDYAECEVRRIEPQLDRSTTGCHHFDVAQDMFIMDVRRAYGAKLLGARPIAVRAT